MCERAIPAGAGPSIDPISTPAPQIRQRAFSDGSILALALALALTLKLTRSQMARAALYRDKLDALQVPHDASSNNI